MIDLILLQVLKDKEQYDILRPSVRDHLVADTTLTLIRDYAAYFKHYETTEINWDMFPSWFRTQRHPTMKADDFEFYEKLFLRLAETPDPKLAETLKQDLQALDFATRITNSANDLLDGKIDSKHFISGVQERLEKAIEAQEATAEVPWDTSSLGEVAKSLSYDDGLKFRLNCLDQSCGSLHAGRLVVVGAYTDSGKSSILSDQFMANFSLQSATIKGKWYSDRPIMYFNNEGSSGNIKLMCHQALLNSPADRIQRNPDGAEEATLKRLQGKELMHVVPAQGMTIQEIERIVRKFKPCCVIIDMLDNVPSYYDAEGTSDQRFRMLYDHFRQMAVKYDFVAVATSQCTGDANGVERIPLHMMAGSRVAKQSTADLVIMLGKSLQAGKQHSRYIHTPKNKLQSRVPHANRDTDCEVIFDGERRRFKDPED